MNNNSQSTTKKAFAQHIYLLLAYLSLAIILTWPTIVHVATHLPGDGGDDPAIAWNLWWVKFALLNQGRNPFLTDFTFYPIGINLAFYTLTLLNGLTALPLLLNVGVVTASNLHMFFTFTVGAYGAFLLTRYLLATTLPASKTGKPSRNLIWLSAAVAGGFYAFASSKLFYVALGQFNIASNHWIPLAILYLIRSRRQPTRLKNPILAGLFLTMQAWAEMTYATFLLIFIGLYWLYWLLVKLNTRHSSGAPVQSVTPQIRTAALMGLIFLLGLSPILAQILPDMRTEGDFLVEGSGFADAYSADLLGFIIPTMHHPWLGHLITQTNIAYEVGQHIYLGFVLLGLLLLALLTGYRNSAIRFWLLATVIFALLCLGPVITIGGQSSGLPGPFILLQQLPFFKGNRYPSRYSVMLVLCLSVLAGFALMQIGTWLDRKYPARRRQYGLLGLGLIALIFLFEHLSLPLPQSDMTVPDPYRIITADPAEVTVLDIPLAWRNGFRITGPLTTRFMFGQFYQTLHQKRLLQGNTSRNPEFKFQYFTEAPVINSLLALSTGHTLPPEQWAADRAIAADVLDFFDIKYFVVRPYRYEKFDGTEISEVTEAATIPYVETVFSVEKIHDDAQITVYRVKDPAGEESGLRVDTTSPTAPLYFGEGWGRLIPGRPIAAQREAVRLLLPLNQGLPRITIKIVQPAGHPEQTQSVSLALNGWQSPAQTVGHDWQELTFDLPAGIAKPGLNDLWLHFSGVVPFDRSASGITANDMSPAGPNITVVSAGEEVGDFGHIFVNGHEVSPNKRGYNMAIVQPDGQVVAAANFDTHLDPAASPALAAFITAAPPDTFIAVAAADEASLNLGEEAVLALHAIGAATDPRGCFRCSHAVLYNPLDGTTQEALETVRPAGLAVGLGLTEPGLAALVDWIRVEPVEE